MVRFVFILLLSSFTFAIKAKVAPTQESPTQVINIATTEWCPYACEAAEQGKGIVYDYLSELLATRNIELNLVFLPWSRAIKEVESGRYKGLLTAIESEAPNLTFTTVPSMFYQMCFFTDKNNDWQYTDETSLSSLRLAVVKDYGYGEPVDSFIRKQQNNSNLSELSGSDSVKRLVKMIDKQRVDAFIEDKFVVNWQLNGMRYKLRNAGCLKQIPFYMAFEPNYAKKTNINKLIDELLADPKNQARFHQEFLPKYFSVNN